MRAIQRYLIYLAVILMPIQDCILGKSALGYLGSNISFIPLLVSALIDIFMWIYAGKTTLSKRALIWFLYIFGLSAIYIFLWGSESHGFSVIYKTFAEGFIFFLWTYTIFYVDYTPTPGLRRSTYCAFAVLIFGVFACDLHAPGLSAIGSSSLFHITVSYEVDRWRSFSMEPSTFSATVVSLGLASAYFAKNNFSRGFFVTATLILLLASQSKGGLLVLAISAFVILFLKKPSIIRSIVYFLACLVLGSAMAFLALRHFNGLELYDTSATLATRFSLAVWTVLVIAHHPWGVGFSGFYEALTIYLPAAMRFVAKFSPVPLNFIEIAPYVSATNVPLDAKCFLFEYVASFGFPFLIAYVIFGLKITKSLLTQQKNILLVAFIFLLIAFSTYVNGLTLYASFYIAGIANKEYQKC